MGAWQRLAYVFLALVTIGTTGVLYAQVGKHLYDMAQNGSSGFMTPITEDVWTLIPLLLVVLGLASLVYLIVGQVQEERGVQSYRRPPR